MSYDIKYKMRAVEYQIEGHTYKETCKVFKVSETTLTRWIKRAKENDLENKIRERKPKKIYPEKLVEYINEHPDAYLVEIAEEFNCTEGAIRKALKKLGITRKKRQLHTKSNVLKR
ncbi:MAG: IS630 transposase-related protein [Paraclostridium sp.]